MGRVFFEVSWHWLARLKNSGWLGGGRSCVFSFIYFLLLLFFQSYSRSFFLQTPESLHVEKTSFNHVRAQASPELSKQPGLNLLLGVLGENLGKATRHREFM